MTSIRALCAALLLAAGPSVAQAQDAPAATPEPSVDVQAVQTAVLRIPAGTPLEIELTEALSSRTSQEGQLFGLRLRSPIVIDGNEIVAAGATGGGEVIDATPSGFGGRQGRLIISGRYIEIGGQQARIRGMQITAVGADHSNTALAVSMVPYAGIASLLITGGNIEVPVGAHGTARLATDVEIYLEPQELPIEAATPPTTDVRLGGESQQ